MIMITNPAIHKIVVPFQTEVPHLTRFLTKSHRVIYRRKGKISTKTKETKGKDKNTVIKEKEENSRCEI